MGGHGTSEGEYIWQGMSGVPTQTYKEMGGLDSFSFCNGAILFPPRKYEIITSPSPTYIYLADLFLHFLTWTMKKMYMKKMYTFSYLFVIPQFVLLGEFWWGFFPYNTSIMLIWMEIIINVKLCLTEA